MRALRLIQEEPEGKTALLCRLLGWNQLEAGIFLGTFGLRGLFSATAEELAALGLPFERAQALQELLDYLNEPAPLAEPFRNSRQVFDSYAGFFRGRTHEIFGLLLLNGKNRVLRHEIISEGSLTASLVHPREVFTPAIRHSAAAVICMHNHPSGDPEPSAEDRSITRRLCEDRKSTRLNSSHSRASRMPSSA